MPVPQVKRIAFRDFLRTYPWAKDSTIDYYSTGLIPAIHLALSDPKEATFPSWSNDLDQSVSYWEGACYVMIGLLGWSNPAKGLLWWHEHGKEDQGDPRLALLSELWDDEQQFDLLAAWFWSKTSLEQWNFFEPMTVQGDTGICPPMVFSPDSEWWVAFRRKFAIEPAYPNPFFGGTNALHLLHLSSPWELSREGNPNPTKLIKGLPETMCARLYLAKPKGWISVLSTKARWLGHLGWAVDVVIDGWGWLGTFRRSPVTGLWYQGLHHIHLAGNVHAFADAKSEHWSDADYVSDDDVLPVDNNVLRFIEKERLKPVASGRSPNFAFQIGERRRSAGGMQRTICGFAHSDVSEPYYIILMHESGQFAAKHAWKAHEEYGPVNGIIPGEIG